MTFNIKFFSNVKSYFCQNKTIEPIKNCEKKPIFYSKHYDFKFWGLENWHIFDSKKWGRIIDFLIEKSNNRITYDCIYEPEEATYQELSLVHSETYLSSLSRMNVATILEIPIAVLCPINILMKLRYQVKGTMMAAEMALDKKWAINVGGGFHHASADSGGGFCVYADISIAIEAIKKVHPDYAFLIVDLDAHQGNGHERDFPPGNNVFIMDMYNEGIYPHDYEAKRNISLDVTLKSWTKDEEYLKTLEKNLKLCFESCSPNLIVYNAGTDCLEGDPLGRLDITAKGIIERDEMVFQIAKDKNVPIVMVTSGGYQHSNAEIIADSIVNLLDKKIIE